ncbi:MAG: protein YgfX [Oxalobacter sp.]
MAAFSTVTAGLMQTGTIGAFAFGASWWVSFILVAVSFFLAVKWFRMPIGYRLAVTVDCHFYITQAIPRLVEDDKSEQWEMQADSTVWPSVIILRLLTATGKKKTLVLFQDTMEKETFRKLYTACSWRLARLRTAIPQL